MNYEIRSISESAYQIIEHHPTVDVYMYLICGTKEALLIDTGYGIIPLDGIVRELTSLPVQVVLTHGHFDHIGASGGFARVCIHEKDITLYRSHKSSGDPAGVPCLFAPGEEPRLIGDDEVFDLGDRKISVLPVPGHSRGCICLYDEKENLLYTGDCCCVGDVLLNLENAGTPEVYLESLCRLQAFVQEHNIEITWPGHHACPVGVDIIEEFKEMTQMLIAGELPVMLMETPFGPGRHASWKRVGIWL